jgi:Carboxypeptidase regulatory-like domain
MGMAGYRVEAESVTKRISGRVPLAVLLLVLAPHVLKAQAVSGTILGSVQDSTGAAVPGVSVTLANSETGLTRVVTTDSGGEYNARHYHPACTPSRLN